MTDNFFFIYLSVGTCLLLPITVAFAKTSNTSELLAGTRGNKKGKTLLTPFVRLTSLKPEMTV